MQEELIAPCGMNCALCAAHLALVHDLNHKGFRRVTCPGCVPRRKKTYRWGEEPAADLPAAGCVSGEAGDGL